MGKSGDIMKYRQIKVKKTAKIMIHQKHTHKMNSFIFHNENGESFFTLHFKFFELFKKKKNSTTKKTNRYGEKE